MKFAITSYIAAALAFAFLAMVLLTGWRGKPIATRLLFASIATAVWAATLAFAASQERIEFIWLFSTEILRDAFWLVLLTHMARGIVPRTLIWSVHALWIGLLVSGLVLPLTPLREVIEGSGALWLSRSGLALAFASCVLIEQIYRNSTAAAQKSLLYFVVGVGSLFAYDLFLYAQAELLKGMQTDVWAARGAIVALTAPLIAVSARRNSDWALDIFVSRQVVFYSSAFLAAGTYFFLMAIGGYYVRAMGGTWGGIAQIVFFTGACMVLAGILFSSAARRRLMVFISKHFFRNKYDYRIEWLRFIQTLSSGGDTDIRRTSLQAIAQIFSSPGGLLFTLGENGRFFHTTARWSQSAEIGGERLSAADEIAADHEMVALLRDRQWVIDLEEYARAPDRYQNIALPDCIRGATGIRIVAPLLELDRLVGFVALLSPPAPFELTFEDRDLVKTVGRHVATYIAQHDANKKLAESRQFEAYSRLTAFMMHDLKNAAAQLALIVANAGRHKHNPDFVDDAIGTIGNATERITRLIEQLQRGTSVQVGRRIDVGPILQRAVGRCLARQPAPQYQPLDKRTFVTADPDRLEMVIEHVIRNAQDATPQDGKITVFLTSDSERVSIIVEDTGQGMSPEFVRDRLFRPFDSTKGSKGMGIGAYQAREYVRSLGGEVSVESTRGVGTRFAIHLPLSITGTAGSGALDFETQTQATTDSTRHSSTLASDVTPATHSMADR
jgi:putative PEP-CTERM system histidine kinase